jgi:hypothetical protein
MSQAVKKGWGSRRDRFLPLIAAALLILMPSAGAQNDASAVLGARRPDAPLKHRSVIRDWSTRQVLFSAIEPKSPRFLKVQSEPRYRMQDDERAARIGSYLPATGRLAARGKRGPSKAQTHRDWSFDLGAGASSGDGMFPAKFSFDIDVADCINDFVVFNTGGAAGANLIAFNNLYNGCAGTVPNVLWAYVTGSGATLTSPVLSLDGSKVAFIENSAAGAVLRILKWRAGQGSFNQRTHQWAGATVDNSELADWASCGSDESCMISIPLSGAPQDTNSPPFYDYSTDNLYAGDDHGMLHKFSGIFNGTPSELGGAWPIAVNPGRILTGPSFDSVSSNVFIGDSSGRLSYVRDLASTAGACASGIPPCIGASYIDVGNGSGRPIIDGPMVDPSIQKVYAFIGCSLNGGGYDGAAGQVIQSDTALSSSVRANLGQASTVDNLHNGIFDNSYLMGNYATAHLYACGNPDSWEGRYLYSIGFDSAGTMNGIATVGPLLTKSAPNECSPLSEIDNNGIDRIFFSVPNNGSAAIAVGGNKCSGACVYSYDITNGVLSTKTTATAGLPVAGGSSGIVIDNRAAAPVGASQIYFSTLVNGPCGTSGGNGGCATQASQAGLN